MNIVQKKDYYKNKPELFTAKLEIFAKENPPKRVNRPEACGLRHLAFSVASIGVRPHKESRCKAVSSGLYGADF